VVKPFTLFIALTLFLCSLAQAGINAVASVDRNQITDQDSLNLSIKIDDTGRYDTPDLSALENDFQVLGTHQNSRHAMVNGRSSSSTEWQITLFPKRSGTLTIPPITVEGATTEPITVQVTPYTPAAGELEPIFLESSVSHNDVFVGQQLIFNLRIFHNVQLDRLNITEPSFDNANLKKLKQNSFNRRLAGSTYRVHEISYAIVPNEAGELIIPEQIFTAVTVDNRSRFYVNPQAGQLVRRMSEQHIIKVKAPPADAPALWLPASQLHIEQSWSGEPTALTVGDSITRTITVTAKGLLPNQLPPHTFAAVDGLKFYPDKGSADSQQSDEGFIAQRNDSTAIIATRPGSFTLPPIDIVWWDVNAKQFKTASLPATTLTVTSASDSSNPGSHASTPNALDFSQAQTNTPATDDVKTVVQYQQHPGWIIASGFFALAWLITLLLYWRRQPRQVENTNRSEASEHNVSESALWRELQQALQGNQAKASAPLIISWAKARWPQAQLQSLQALAEFCQQEHLSDTLAELDRALYSGEEQAWQGERLLKALSEQRKTSAGKTAAPALKPLYPR
jgi:hypothetical protein